MAMSVPITVVIPVGPEPKDCAYLEECLDSVDAEQNVKPAHIVFVDDMHTGHGDMIADCILQMAVVRDLVSGVQYTVAKNSWNLGVAASFNVGVALAPTEHVLLLGADDWLEPDAIAYAQHTIAEWPAERGYYWYRVRYTDDRPNRDQGVPCGAAVVTKALWRATGGFPVESAVGRSDSMLVGLLMSRPEVGDLTHIADNSVPPYNCRIHSGQHTASRGPWLPALEATAQAFWQTWEAPRWGRYE